MSTENTNIDVPVEDNLDLFSAELFGESTADTSDTAKSEEVEDVTETVDDAPEEEDTHSADDGATDEDEAEEVEDSEETDSDSDNKPKGKNRYQERINELTAKARQAERERDELKKALEQKNSPPEPEPKKPEQVAATTTGEPKPTDKTEDGKDKYPLGEFDPRFLKDTVQFMLNQQEAERAAEAQRIAEQQKAYEERSSLQESWNTKLVDAQERYPDFHDKGEQMLSVFEGIDEQYGQYLTDTLMEMDAGPDVFYYLSNHLDEAQEIVNAGPRKATIALAKLEAQLVGTTKPKGPSVRTTKAPPPPPRVKGSSVSKPSVALDSDDLDSFSRELFRRK
jgi:hypothetical protein